MSGPAPLRPPAVPHPLAWPGPDEVHLWNWRLDPDESRLHAFKRMLSGAEIERALRPFRSRDRTRFIAARGGLRMLLGRYLGRAPGAIAFAENEFGKPCLADGSGGPPLHFNLSHAEDRAVLAVAAGFEVGVDVERLERDRDLAASDLFSQDERRALLSLPAERRAEAFLRCWTRKEAFVKAVGGGLSIPLDGFTMSLGPDEPARLVAVAALPQEAARWQIVHLEPAPGYVGAVAARRRRWSVTALDADRIEP